MTGYVKISTESSYEHAVKRVGKQHVVVDSQGKELGRFLQPENAYRFCNLLNAPADIDSLIDAWRALRLVKGIFKNEDDD